MIYIRIRSQQPICVAAEQAQGTIRRTLDYIPGSALRGALAACLNAARPNISQPDFDHLMLADGAQFQNLYPLPPGRDVVRPLPSTARSCKLYFGFVPLQEKAGQRPQHGVRDFLFPSLRYALAGGHQQAAPLPDQHCGHDDQCDLPLEPFSGVYGGFEPGYYVKAEPKQRQVTQTAIDPHRETASPANLFTVEVLEEGTEFAGFFALGDPTAEEGFCDTICSTGDQLRLGYGRTRGLGLVEVVTCRVERPYLWDDDLASRLWTFNDTARKQKCDVPAGHSLLAITLLSDTIILDPFCRHQAGIDGPTLAREIHQDLAGAKLIAAFADTRSVFGWNGQHGLPLPADLAITTGSVFVFQVPLELERLADVLEETDVERQGIGERRAEGFGQLVICHPFHQEVNPV